MEVREPGDEPAVEGVTGRRDEVILLFRSIASDHGDHEVDLACLQKHPFGQVHALSLGEELGATWPGDIRTELQPLLRAARKKRYGEGVQLRGGQSQWRSFQHQSRRGDEDTAQRCDLTGLRALLVDHEPSASAGRLFEDDLAVEALWQLGTRRGSLSRLPSQVHRECMRGHSTPPSKLVNSSVHFTKTVRWVIRMSQEEVHDGVHPPAQRLNARSVVTHQRIVDAAIRLHQTLGPARTTISDIAREAGVQRLTVYRHFPDERALRAACSSTYRVRHPPPDPLVWGQIADPEQRLRQALGELFPYYRQTQEMFTRVLRDAQVHPLVREAAQGRVAYAASVRQVLEPGWPHRGRRRRWLSAALAHAVDFRTWESFANEHALADKAIIEILVAFVKGTGSSCGGQAARPR